MPKFAEGFAAKLEVPAGAKDVQVFDDELPGFGIRKFATGAASYFVKYNVGSQQRRKTLGRVVKGNLKAMRLEASAILAKARLGTDVVAPPGKKFGSFTRPGVRFGKPLDFSRYEGMENDRYILRSITDEIMYEIMRLSGQEYVDMYASRAKEESKKAASAEAGQPDEPVEAAGGTDPDGTEQKQAS